MAVPNCLSSASAAVHNIHQGDMPGFPGSLEELGFGRQCGGVRGMKRATMSSEHRSGKPHGTGKTCALCGTSLTNENNSTEHVIPNALGGRKTLRNFICVKCNSRTGSDWDAELVRQLHPLCTMLNVSRTRGRNRQFLVETLSDRRLVVNPDGPMTIAEPVFEAQEQDDRIEVTIRARTMAEMRKMVSGLKRKYPQIDVDELMKRAERTQEYSREPYGIPLNVGGLLAGRSIVKSCLAMVYDRGLSIGDCREAELFLLDQGRPCFGFYSGRDLVKNRPESTYFHCVHVCGDAEKCQLLAYVEYFGWLRCLACLSTNYEGLSFSHCYAVDPVSGKELDLDVELTLDAWDVTEIFEQKKVDFSEVGRDLHVLVETWREMDHNRARTDAIDDALRSACDECGIQEGSALSDEQATEFARVVSKRLEPFLAHTMLGSGITEEELTKIKRKSKASGA